MDVEPLRCKRNPTFDRASLRVRAAAAVAAVVVSATSLGAVLALYADPGIAISTARAAPRDGQAAAPQRLAMTSFDRRMAADPAPGIGPRSLVWTRPCLTDRRLCV